MSWNNLASQWTEDDTWRVIIILMGLWSSFAIVRYDIIKGHFVTGGMVLSSVTLGVLVLGVQIVRGEFPSLSHFQYLAQAVLYFAIGKSYWDIRQWRKWAEQQVSPTERDCRDATEAAL